jgi:hypothetical protein
VGNDGVVGHRTLSLIVRDGRPIAVAWEHETVCVRLMVATYQFTTTVATASANDATDFGEGNFGGVSQIGFSHPIETIEVPRVVATVCRDVNAKLCPLEFISPIYVGCIGKQVLLWMVPKLHLMDQTGEFFHTSHRMFDCVGQLVAASERVPYLDDKGIRFTRDSLPSDFQRWSAQPVPIHLLSRGHPSACIHTDE